ALELKGRPMETKAAKVQQSTRDLLSLSAERAQKYVQEIAQRRVAPTGKDVAELSRFHEPFPASPTDSAEVLALLDQVGSPATVATTGGRYFGFVVGGALPA